MQSSTKQANKLTGLFQTKFLLPMRTVAYKNLRKFRSSFLGSNDYFISSNPLSPSTSLRIERSYIFDKLGLLPPPPRNPISNASFADLNNDSLTGSYVNFSLEIPSLYSSSGIVLPVSLSSS